MTDRKERTDREREATRQSNAQRRAALRREAAHRQPYRELTDIEEADIGVEGVAGEGEEESGTVPGSVAGTTGTAGRAAGIQSPGASAPPVRGIDPDEVRGKVGRLRPKDGA